MPPSLLFRTLDDVYAEIEPTISREAAYWSSKFPHSENVTRDVLYQEGWITAATVLRHFDTARGASLTSLLTLSLRHRFTDLLKRAFRSYHRRALATLDSLDGANSPNRHVLAIPGQQEGLAFLASLTNDERRIAGYLLDCNGSALSVARRYKVEVATVNRFRKTIQAKLA